MLLFPLEFFMQMVIVNKQTISFVPYSWSTYWLLDFCLIFKEYLIISLLILTCVITARSDLA